MTKPKGRTDDMLIIRGINVFPSQIESVLLDLGMDPNYRMIVDRKNNLDTLEVQVEMNESLFSDTVRNLERVEQTIANDLHSTLNIAAKITLLEPKSIERSEGKAKRGHRQAEAGVIFLPARLDKSFPVWYTGHNERTAIFWKELTVCRSNSFLCS